MRFPAALSHPHGPPGGSFVTAKALVRSQTFRDKLYVAGVVALVLTTVALVVGYGIHEWPRWMAQDMGGFDTAVLPLPTQVSPGEAAAVDATLGDSHGVNRTSLIVTSMVVDAVIFVALGLYLRREMNQKP